MPDVDRSEDIDLADESVYRDLSKPIGALSAKRLDYFQERMTGMSKEDRFLYGAYIYIYMLCIYIYIYMHISLSLYIYIYT